MVIFSRNIHSPSWCFLPVEGISVSAILSILTLCPRKRSDLPMNWGARTGQSEHHCSSSPPLGGQWPQEASVCPSHVVTGVAPMEWGSIPGWGVNLILGFSITHGHKPHSPISALSVIKMICQSPSILFHVYHIKTHIRKARLLCTYPCEYHLLCLSSVTLKKNN